MIIGCLAFGNPISAEVFAHQRRAILSVPYRPARRKRSACESRCPDGHSFRWSNQRTFRAVGSRRIQIQPIQAEHSAAIRRKLPRRVQPRDCAARGPGNASSCPRRRIDRSTRRTRRAAGRVRYASNRAAAADVTPPNAPRPPLAARPPPVAPTSLIASRSAPPARAAVSALASAWRLPFRATSCPFFQNCFVERDPQRRFRIASPASRRPSHVPNQLCALRTTVFPSAFTASVVRAVTSSPGFAFFESTGEVSAR